MIPNFTLSVLQKKIAFSTIVQYAGKLLQLAMATITIKWITNFLSPAEHGIYGAITEYAIFFSVVANLGIFANVVRKMADEPTNGKIFMNALVLRLITAFVFFVIGIIVIAFNNDPVFIFGATLFLGTLLMDYVTSVCDGALQANYMMGRATIATLIGRFVYFGMIFILTKWGASFGITSMKAVLLLLVASLLASFITAMVSFYFVKQKIPLTFQFDRAFMWDILKVSLPFGLINIVNSLYFRFLPDLFANKALTEAQFATFNISFKIAQVASLLSTYLVFSILPGLKQYLDQKHWQKAQKLYVFTERFLLFCGLILVGVGFFGATIIEFLTHKQYFLPEFWFILPMMLFLAAISYIYDLILLTLFALEKDRWLLKMEACALALALIVFMVSLATSNVQLKLVLILMAAIVGESTMVIAGSYKARKLLRLESEKMMNQQVA